MIKRTMPLAFVAFGCLIGYALPRPAMLAQAPAAPTLPIFTIDGSKYPRAENGKGVIWTAEELRGKYVTPANAPGSDHLQWAPPYRITIQRRQPPQAGATINGELHDDKTQIYIVIGGSGTVQLGGKPDVDNSAGPGRAPRRTTGRHDVAPREGRRRGVDSASHLARVVRRPWTGDDVSDGSRREPPDDSVTV